MIAGNDRFCEEIEALRPMVKIKFATDAPNFKSASKPANASNWHMYPLAYRRGLLKRQADG